MAKASYIGIEKILQGFEEKADTPFYSVWVGKSKAEENKLNDFDKAASKLEKQLKVWIDEDFTDIFVIALHPEKKATYSYTDCKDAVLMYCQIRKTEQPAYYQHNTMINPNMQILEKLNAIESRINAIEADSDVDEEETEEIGSNEAVLIDKIAGIANSPLVNVLLNIFTNISNKQGMQQPVAALAGTDELDDVLNVLFDKGVTLDHLKKLASYPKEKIQMLLSMM